MASQTENVIFAIGNPLLDISATGDAALLEKYGLDANNAILAEEKHMPLYAELAALPTVGYTAGGATLNTIRVAQHFLGNEKATTFVGCVGADAYAEKMATSAGGDGVRTEFKVDETTGTGTCACVITGKHRSLVANLSAANNYSADHLQSDAIWSLVEAAQIYYSAGFHLTVSPESMMHVARHAAAANKPYALNLSAPFLIQFFADPMAEILPYADYVFCNEDEAATYAKQHSLPSETDLKAIALAIASTDKVNTERKRTVVITCGAEETIVAYAGETSVFPVDAIEADKIVDTNGAGDAFVGGFLASLAKGEDVKACVEAGHTAARLIIQTSGIVLPSLE